MSGLDSMTDDEVFRVIDKTNADMAKLAQKERRERIATAAMQGYIAAGRQHLRSVALESLRMADALIAELDK